MNNLAGLSELQNLLGPNGGNKVLVEFKAGRMTYDGRMVKPERKRGIVKVI